MKNLNRYKPKHEPNCNCAVCTTAAFVEEMHARNDAREKRCHEILNNPFGNRSGPSFWTLERHVKGTPFVPMYRSDTTEGQQP